ncbi:GTP pyrophosphokinase [Patescibacteria group bacterium]|nr:GTP pyrophosphokinase [Patescibacteria group bacterium]
MTLHEGQTDKAGEPYILHLLRVSASLRDPTDRIVALLHDAVEDGKTTFEQLLAMGYPEFEVVTPLRFLTKGRDEPYLDFILRVATGPDRAIRVKRKDLRDNRNLKRLPKVTKKDEVRRRKYKLAEKILTAALKMRRLLRAHE